MKPPRELASVLYAMQRRPEIHDLITPLMSASPRWN